jgi:hypothetical protein
MNASSSHHQRIINASSLSWLSEKDILRLNKAHNYTPTRF